MRLKFFALSGMLTFCASALAMFAVPDDAALRYSTIPGDGAKVKWIYDRIHSVGAIDIAFFGASYVLQSTVPTVVAAHLPRSTQVVNFAAPYVGRDLEYVLLKETLRHKKLQTVVLQLRHQEGRSPHRMFCELADKSDMLAQPYLPFFMPVRDLDCFFKRQVRLAKAAFIAEGQDETVADPYAATAGYKPVDHVDTYSNLERDKNSLVTPLLPTKLRSLEFSYGRHYLKEIAALTRKHRVNVAFLHLPSYKEHRPPSDLHLISAIGKVIYLPRHIIDNPHYRSDAEHFNHAGALEVSQVVGRSLRELAAGQTADL